MENREHLLLNSRDDSIDDAMETREISELDATQSENPVLTTRQLYYINNRERLLQDGKKYSDKRIEKKKEYQQKNKEKYNQYMRDYYSKNRERMLEQQKISKMRKREVKPHKNKPQIFEKQRDFKKKNREKHLQTRRLWYYKNREKIRNYNRTWRENRLMKEKEGLQWNTKKDHGHVLTLENVKHFRLKKCSVLIERLNLPAISEWNLETEENCEDISITFSSITHQKRNEISRSRLSEQTDNITNPLHSSRVPEIMAGKRKQLNGVAQTECPQVKRFALNDVNQMKNLFIEVEKMLLDRTTNMV